MSLNTIADTALSLHPHIIGTEGITREIAHADDRIGVAMRARAIYGKDATEAPEELARGIYFALRAARLLGMDIDAEVARIGRQYGDIAAKMTADRAARGGR